MLNLPLLLECEACVNCESECEPAITEKNDWEVFIVTLNSVSSSMDNF